MTAMRYTWCNERYYQSLQVTAESPKTYGCQINDEIFFTKNIQLLLAQYHIFIYIQKLSSLLHKAK